MYVVVVHVDNMGDMLDDGLGTGRNSVSIANGVKWDQDLKGII